MNRTIPKIGAAVVNGTGGNFYGADKEKQYDWVCYMVTFGSVYNWIRNKRYVF